ncbi:MAG: hypothetical protein CO088_01490 [Candidatus Yonathbacteria bacterium CG_4_9_14_0_8_um_filter_46_47]|uniref:Uncharacterized protein n=1 Tax=Candidatus Yonathbacteria bacterium CG_4_9_14_0_8_um_filter_46_47 TaxID=1975106 RepID=A0A2M8D8G8_9BACT|nr:MAG: hypothetical protein CO088_01490 [Candidatus Yonathbacteria bacterium CG_4_9_14_0_8_um_filter_46_47]
MLPALNFKFQTAGARISDLYRGALPKFGKWGEYPSGKSAENVGDQHNTNEDEENTYEFVEQTASARTSEVCFRPTDGAKILMHPFSIPGNGKADAEYHDANNHTSDHRENIKEIIR